MVKLKWDREKEGLRRMKLQIHTALDGRLSDVLAMASESDVFVGQGRYFADETVVMIQEIVAGEYVHAPAVTYPSGWFEAVKEHFLPAWAKKRWPVVYNQVEWEVRVIYPQLSLPHDKHAIAQIGTYTKEVSDES